MQKKEIIPKLMRLPLVLAIVCNTIAYNGSRLLTGGRVHYDLSNSLDDKIPLLPWTVVIYLGCYIFWVVNYVIGCRQDEKTAFRFISADFAAKIVCLLCFVLFPTTNVRPAIEGTSVWDNIMRGLYWIDPADNLFPSIHCLTSWFCFIAVRKNDKIPKWYKIVSALIAVSICISTLTTRQHVLIDVIAGIALAEGSYLFVWKSGFSKRYAAMISKISNKLAARRERRA
ncbi:MAG: phosphatase PAP2 family protein [Lachnospiraceae bacterium]